MAFSNLVSGLDLVHLVLVHVRVRLPFRRVKTRRELGVIYEGTREREDERQRRTLGL